MAISYQAVVPLVIAKDGDDRDIYIYAGEIVPDNVSKDSVKRLLAENFIQKVTPDSATSDTDTAASDATSAK